MGLSHKYTSGWFPQTTRKVCIMAHINFTNILERLENVSHEDKNFLIARILEVEHALGRGNDFIIVSQPCEDEQPVVHLFERHYDRWTSIVLMTPYDDRGFTQTHDLTGGWMFCLYALLDGGDIKPSTLDEVSKLQAKHDAYHLTWKYDVVVLVDDDGDTITFYDKGNSYVANGKEKSYSQTEHDLYKLLRTGYKVVFKGHR